MLTAVTITDEQIRELRDEQRRDRQAAKKFWAKLDLEDRWMLGDHLVLGEFDWRDWFADKPSKAFMNALDEERIYWESTNE